MDDKKRKLRQLEALMRLRKMKRSQAEILHGRARQLLSDANRAFEHDLSRYRHAADTYQYLLAGGAIINPELSQQRLDCLMEVQTQVECHQQKLKTEKANYRAIRRDLIQKNLSVEVVVKADERTRGDVFLDEYKKQQIDIGDASVNAGQK